MYDWIIVSREMLNAVISSTFHTLLCLFCNYYQNFKTLLSFYIISAKMPILSPYFVLSVFILEGFLGCLAIANGSSTPTLSNEMQRSDDFIYGCMEEPVIHLEVQLTLFVYLSAWKIENRWLSKYMSHFSPMSLPVTVCSKIQRLPGTSPDIYYMTKFLGCVFLSICGELSVLLLYVCLCLNFLFLQSHRDYMATDYVCLKMFPRAKILMLRLTWSIQSSEELPGEFYKAEI